MDDLAFLAFPYIRLIQLLLEASEIVNQAAYLTLFSAQPHSRDPGPLGTDQLAAAHHHPEC